MKQAIAGVIPAAEREATVMIVWPSIARFSIARFMARTFFDIRLGVLSFTLGNLIALLTAPLGALLYLTCVAPFVGLRYRVTNRRIVVERGMRGRNEVRSLRLDRFDAITVQVRPGQQWYHAGDLIFFHGDTEVFRLEGVARPEAFRQVCMKSHAAFVGVQQVTGQLVGAGS